MTRKNLFNKNNIIKISNIILYVICKLLCNMAMMKYITQILQHRIILFLTKKNVWRRNLIKQVSQLKYQNYLAIKLHINVQNVNDKVYFATLNIIKAHYKERSE